MDDSRIDEIAPDIYRISAFHPGYGIQFNQFVVLDDEPVLIHTGLRRSFPQTLATVSRLLDPARLRWIGYSHFEPDECGALNEWLAAAPQAQAICSIVGAEVMLADFADRPARALADGEVLVTGSHRLRFCWTPHLPHGWDAGLYHDERTGTLFCSDLLFQPDDPPPLTHADLIGLSRALIAASREGPLAHDLPYTPQTTATLQRLAALGPTTLATMHGSSYAGDGAAVLRALATVYAEELGAPGEDGGG